MSQRFRVKKTGKIITEGQLRKDHQNKSLPYHLTVGTLNSLGYEPIVSTNPPTPSTILKRYRANGIKRNSQGQWVDNWKEYDMFSDIEQDGKTITKHDQEQKYLKQYLKTIQDEKCKEVEQYRDKVLYNGISFKDANLDIKLDSRNEKEINYLLNLLPTASSITDKSYSELFRDGNNNIVTFYIDDMIQVGKYFRKWYQHVCITCSKHKDIIRNIGVGEEIKLSDISILEKYDIK